MIAVILHSGYPGICKYNDTSNEGFKLLLPLQAKSSLCIARVLTGLFQQGEMLQAWYYLIVPDDM